MTDSRFRSLDSFRGLAILMVVAGHCLYRHFDAYGWFFGRIAGKLHLGVQIFFVIGGFAIAGSLDRALDRRGSAWEFMKRRVSRIYVPHLFGLAFAALILPTIVGLLPVLKGNRPLFHHYYAYSGWEWLGIATLAKPLFEDAILSGSFRPLNPALWYVCVIMQIYGIVALAVCFGAKARVFLAAITVLAVLPWIPQMSAHVPKWVFLPLWPCFYAGMLLFWAVQKQWFLTRTAAGSWLAGTLALCAMVVVMYSSRALWWPKGLFSVAVVVLFWVIYPFDETISRSAPMRALAFVGAFSYSLFIMHLPLRHMLRIVMSRLPMVSQIPKHVSVPIILIPSIVVLSFVWFLFFEEPGSIKATGAALLSPLATLRGAARPERS